MAITVSQFKDRFSEFDSVDDSEIQTALNDAADLMDTIRWGTRFNTGQALLAAHFVALSTGNVGNGGGSVGPISQAATGPLSVQYMAFAASSSSEAMLGSTRYGQRYQQLRGIVGMGGTVV